MDLLMGKVGHASRMGRQMAHQHGAELEKVAMLGALANAGKQVAGFAMRNPRLAAGAVGAGVGGAVGGTEGAVAGGALGALGGRKIMGSIAGKKAVFGQGAKNYMRDAYKPTMAGAVQSANPLSILKMAIALKLAAG